MTYGDRRDGFAAKVAKRGPFLAGYCGNVCHGQAFLDWFRSGMKGDPPKMKADDEHAYGLIIMPDDSCLTYHGLGWERSADRFYAVGSGSGYAVGALEQGATAEQAVAVAIKYDTKSGGEITVLRRQR